MDLHEIFGDRVDDMDEDRMDQAWIVTQVSEHVKEEVLEEVEKVDRKVDSTVSTYDKLMENEEYRELPEKTQRLIWELVKIRENDSPKNQTTVAEQYDVTDAHLSQVKQKIDKLGL
jgi:glutamine synthetase adenylyltransferase